jgi:hypothetical protein
VHRTEAEVPPPPLDVSQVRQAGAVDEEILAGGVANAGAVVRVGDAVLRPANPHSESIHRFLSLLANVGFDGSSVPLGFEPDGRERLKYIAGDVALAPYPSWVQSDDALVSIARLMRAFHDASQGVGPVSGTWSDEMADPAGGTIVCHNDVCLENVVFRDGVAVALLDFDFAAPGQPLFDLAAFARMCVPIDDEINASRLGWKPADRPSRLRLVADAYGLDHDQRRELVGLLAESMARGGEFVRRRVAHGDPNFIAMWNEMGGAERFDRRQRWWDDNRDRFQATLD